MAGGDSRVISTSYLRARAARARSACLLEGPGSYILYRGIFSLVRPKTLTKLRSRDLRLGTRRYSFTAVMATACCEGRNTAVSSVRCSRRFVNAVREQCSFVFVCVRLRWRSRLVCPFVNTPFANTVRSCSFTKQTT